jgi:hypothetical protein
MNTEIEPIDYDDLKRRISEAIGKTFHELRAGPGNLHRTISGVSA